MKITIRNVDYHRNGVCGEPFHIVHFTDPEEGNLMGVVFESDDLAPHVAIFNEDKLPNTTFAVNSYRGDRYAPKLKAAIPLWDEVRAIIDSDALVADKQAAQARLTI